MCTKLIELWEMFLTSKANRVARNVEFAEIRTEETGAHEFWTPNSEVSAHNVHGTGSFAWPLAHFHISFIYSLHSARFLLLAHFFSSSWFEIVWKLTASISYSFYQMCIVWNEFLTSGVIIDEKVSADCIDKTTNSRHTTAAWGTGGGWVKHDAQFG